MNKNIHKKNIHHKSNIKRLSIKKIILYVLVVFVIYLIVNTIRKTNTNINSKDVIKMYNKYVNKYGSNETIQTLYRSALNKNNTSILLLHNNDIGKVNYIANDIIYIRNKKYPSNLLKWNMPLLNMSDTYNNPEYAFNKLQNYNKQHKYGVVLVPNFEKFKNNWAFFHDLLGSNLNSNLMFIFALNMGEDNRFKNNASSENASLLKYVVYDILKLPKSDNISPGATFRRLGMVTHL
jgi:hypothetical protein